MSQWWVGIKHPYVFHEVIILPDDVAGPIEHHIFETDFQARVFAAAEYGHYLRRTWRSQPPDTSLDIYIWHQ